MIMLQENDVVVPNSTPTIIFENDDIVVIDKPHGLLVHEHERSEGAPTVVDWFLKHTPSAKGVGEAMLTKDGASLERSGVVHRLDRETSGVMVLAKTPDAHAHLKAQFQDRLVKKEYRAFVYGRVRDRWGTIDRPIGRSTKDFRLRSAHKGAKGVLRDAVTNFECIGIGEYEEEPFSYLKLLPKTGRMHQLRVHLKAIERPIVGDELYAQKECAVSNNLGFDRLALHAHVLELTLPGGEVERFIAPLPHDFELAAERIAE